MKKGTLLTIIFLVGMVYVSFTLILTGNDLECEVCINYNNGEQCQIVQGREEKETVMQGISTACGALANGMTESIECQAVVPIKQECRKL